MSAYNVSSLIIAGLALIVNTAVLLLLLQQIRLLSRQVADAKQAINFSTTQAALENDRLRRQSTMDFISNTLSKLQDLYGRLPSATSLKQKQFLTDALVTDSQEFLDLRNYLNYLEDIAAGMNMGIFDDDVVNRTIGGRILRAWDNYKPWALQERERLSPTLYEELERCAAHLAKLRDAPRHDDILDSGDRLSDRLATVKELTDRRLDAD